MRTQRELDKETDSFKKNMFDLSLKLELLRKQNNELKDQVEVYQKRVEELEPLEDQNHDLREKNSRLTLDMQIMEDEVVDLREQNGEILKIQEESVVAMEKTTAGLQEAAEIIDRLEQEKAALAQENEQMRAQAANAQIAPRYSTDTDGSANDRFPSRVYSVDESRPSTSHFDSDYYSQPASPRVKASKESLPSVVVSKRAEKFISMKKETQRSTRDLQKRVSDASMRQKKKKELEPTPQVPLIPEAYQPVPAFPGPNRTPKRIKSVRATSLSPALAVDPYTSIHSGSAPHTPTGTMEGLRAMYQNGLTLDTSLRNSRPSSSANSPLASKSLKKSSRGSDAPVAPARRSSRVAPTSYSAEQLKPDSSSEVSQPYTEPETESEWDSMAPPSIISDDLTTELGVGNSVPWWNTLHPWGSQNHAGVPGSYPSLGTGNARWALKDNKAAPYTEANLLFNPAEDEDDFLERTRSLGRRQR